jgi:hypothetical protein
VIVGVGDMIVHHSVREDFGQLLRAALHGTPVYAAFGPIYAVDPAEAMLAPFIRSAKEAGMDPDLMCIQELVPQQFIEKITFLRRNAVVTWTGIWRDIEHWTRAGLVLETASRRGVHFKEGTKAHVRWRMRGTMTGRFGVEPGGFNPMVIPREQRARIVPSAAERAVVVIDFRSMDLSSMVSVVPGLAERYAGAQDLHSRTADLVGIARDIAKKELFVHAYGGHSSYAEQFEKHLPELTSRKGADLARLVQTTSATAFKAGLSMALPLLVDGNIRPMFTVHDELTLDVLNEALPTVRHVSKAMEDGASERIGVPYTTGSSVGRNYSEAKA